jgi:ketosteroid isomerase-like protein
MSTQDEIRRLYAAFNRRDIDSVIESLAEDVVWANGWEGGHVRGRAAVRDYWSRQFAALRPRVEPEEITLADDGRVTVRVHQLVWSAAGELLADQRVTHLYRFEDGKVARFDIASSAR